MQITFALAALASVAFAAPRPQGVTQDISPSAPPPAGCSLSYSGNFQIAAVNVTKVAARSLEARSSCGAAGSLTLTLANGKLLDGQGRTGYIASNYQFQFDKPAQTGAIYTDGFSSCTNGSLALGGSAIFYQCLSGSFYNLYDRNWAPHCNAIALQILSCTGSTPSNGVGAKPDGQPTGTAVGPVSQISDGQAQGPTKVPVVSQLPDGQPQAPSIMPAPITQIGDGQVQAPTATATAAPVSQISDGQVQAPTSTATAAPVSQISDGQVQAPTSTATAAPVSQISDGQVQAPTSTATAAPVSQISDGQVQAPTATATAAPVSQISDGQVQAPTATATAAPVSQISDGQVQAPTATATAAPVTQISDGQIQAPTSTLAPITQISDGQIQAPTSTLSPVTQIGDGQVQAPTGSNNTASPTPVPFAGAANGLTVGSGFAAFMAVFAVLL